MAETNPEPAFPGAVDCTAPSGMSLRDWFAGQALSAIATPHALKAISDGGGNPSAVMAMTAYDLADAMLAERSKP